MSPYLRSETPIPSWDDGAACSGTRQDYPAARATTARGLDGTRRKPEPHIPHKKEWELLESATGDISIEVRTGTFLTRDDTRSSTHLTSSANEHRLSYRNGLLPCSKGLIFGVFKSRRRSER